MIIDEAAAATALSQTAILATSGGFRAGYQAAKISNWSAIEGRGLRTNFDCRLSDLIQIVRHPDLVEQIEAMTARIVTSDRRIKALAGQADIARRLQTMPGGGPMTALAVEAFAPPMESFKCGRDFAAWLGMVPKQQSSGGKASKPLFRADDLSFCRYAYRQWQHQGCQVLH